MPRSPYSWRKILKNVQNPPVSRRQERNRNPFMMKALGNGAKLIGRQEPRPPPTRGLVLKSGTSLPPQWLVGLACASLFWPAKWEYRYHAISQRWWIYYLRPLRLSWQLRLKGSTCSPRLFALWQHSPASREPAFWVCFRLHRSGYLSLQYSTITLRYVFFRSLEDSWCDDTGEGTIPACRPASERFEHLRQACVAYSSATHLQWALDHT